MSKPRQIIMRYETHVLLDYLGLALGNKTIALDMVMLKANQIEALDGFESPDLKVGMLYYASDCFFEALGRFDCSCGDAISSLVPLVLEDLA